MDDRYFGYEQKIPRKLTGEEKNFVGKRNA
jgi:hypothetical protein